MSKILILGYSNIVQKRIIPALNIIENCDHIEIASRSKIPIKTKKIVKVYSDYFDALNKFDGNIVYISLHNSAHDAFIIESIKRGFSCIVDKPAILNTETIHEIKNLIKLNNCFVAESVVYKDHKAWDSLISILGGKENISHIDSSFRIPDLEENNFRSNVTLGGGAANDMCSYSVSVGRHLWNRKPENIVVSELNYYKNLLKGFSILVDYGDNKSLKGMYGFGYEYVNKISMISNLGECGYERVFSPPENYGVKLKGIIEDKEFVQEGIKDNTFKNFLEKFLMNKIKSPLYWFNETEKSFNDLKMLKSVIEKARKDL